MSRSILIIDDDHALGELLESYLTQFDMTVRIATDPEKGLRLLRENQPDLIILDVMLPGKDGFELCREIRAESHAGIVMLTARGEITDRIVGLELGADDYLPKPFEPRELVARIQSVLRRKNSGASIPSANGYLESQGLLVDPTRRSAQLDGKDLELTTTEFNLLELFMKKSGEVVSRDEIMDSLKGVDWEAFDRSVDVAVSRLRQKLQDPPKHPKFLKTVWGTGYLFLGKVTGKLESKTK